MGRKTLPLILLALPLLAACGHRSLPDACYEKPASGQCRASHTRYYLDSTNGRNGICKPFIWGGCGGNVPFETLEECRRTCNAPGPEGPVSGKQPAGPPDSED